MGATQLKAMAKEDGISIIEGSVNGWTNVFINVSDSEGSTGHPLLKEKSVRQAIEYCTDKEAIIEKAYGGVGIVADTIVPITDTQYHYTPEKPENMTLTKQTHCWMRQVMLTVTMTESGKQMASL